MNKDYTHVTMILDRSGSMANLKYDIQGGLPTFIKEQQEFPGKMSFTLVQFDDKYEVSVDFKDINEVGAVEYVPRGWTALYDAIGKAIVSTGERLAALEEADRPGKVLVVIWTDGDENISTEYNQTQIKEMITHQETKYGWQFSFMGANQDSFGKASALNMSNAAAHGNWTADSAGVGQTYVKMSASIGTHRSMPVGTAYKVT